jgi:ATP-dependent RNA helicase CshB
MHRIGRSTRNKSGKSYIIYNDKIDAKLLRLANKNIKWNFLQIKNNLLVKKDIKLKKQKHRLLDEETNSKIRKIIFSNSKKVKPSYKKKIRQQIHKIKQQKRHEFIEKQIKKQLLIKNIKATKNKI